MSTISASTTSTTALVYTADTTGTLVLQTGATPTTAVYIDTAQNVGVGVTPSAWGSNYKVIQTTAGTLSNYTTIAVGLHQNSYDSAAGSFKYITSNYATRYNQEAGVHSWYNAPSGTAGNAITFTQAMTLTAAGNLGINTTSPNVSGQGTDTKVVTISGSSNFWGGVELNNPNTSGGSLLGFIGWTGSNMTTGYTMPAYIGTWLASGTALKQGGELRFHTQSDNTAGATERARINSSGNLLLGSSSYQANTPRLYVTASSQSNSNNNIVWVYDSASAPTAAMHVWSFAATTPGSGNFVDAYYNGVTTLAFRIAGNGNVTNANNSYGSTSDIKLKENITDATPKLEKLNQVRVVNYNLIGDTQKQIGVIAQELEQVFPGMVEESPDYEQVTTTDDEGKETTERVATGTTTKSVKYSVFVPMLIKALQEQQALITQLQADVAALKGAA